MFRKLPLLATASLIAFTAPAFAQETAQATPAESAEGSVQFADSEATDGSEVAEIVVTAQKRSERLKDVPASVAVVSTRDLTKEGVVRFSDYATRVPGMSVTSVRAGQTQVTLRGITTGAAQSASSTGYYIDEAPIGSVNAFTGGSSTTPDLDPSDLSRIEVLKGPQGTLFGSNAMGGLLRFITTSPDFEAIRGRVSAGVTDVRGGEMGYSFRGMLNVPLITDRLVARVSGFTRRDGGYIDNIDPRTGEKNVNSAKVSGGRLLLAAKITPDIRIDLSAIAQDTRANGANVVDVDAASLRPLYGKLSQLRFADESSVVKFRLYNATARATFGPVDLVSSTTYQHTDFTQRNDATNSFGVAIGGLLQLPAGLLGIQGQQDTRTERWSQELRASSTGIASGLLDLQAGFYWTHEKDSNRIPSYDPFLTTDGSTVPLPNIVTAAILSTYKEYSVFGNAVVHITPKFDVLGGLRYSHDSQDYFQDYSGLIIPGGVFTKAGETKKGIVTYLISPRYRFSRDAMVYARLSTGYRPGGPNAAPDFIGAPSAFAPDTLTQFELGYKASYFENRLSIDLAAFYTKWKDIQIQTSLGGFNYFVNGGTATSKGAEATLRFTPVRDFNIGLNAGYTNARLSSDAPAAGGVDGDRLPYVPRWSGSLTADYSVPISSAAKAVFGGSVNYVGSRTSDYSQRLPKHVDAYTTVNLRAGIESDRWSLSAFAKNLTDSGGVLVYASQGLAPSAAPGAPYSAAIIQPRTLGAEVAFRF
jgi:iron complex outermembrane receptor protein